MPRALAALVLAACSGSSAERTCEDLIAGDLPDCAVVRACDTGDTDASPDCVDPIGWSRLCDPGWRAGAGGTSQAGLLYAGELTDDLSSVSSYTFTDAASFDAWRASAFWGEPPPELPPVDFSTQLVVVLQGYQNNTCGMSILRHGVWTSADSPGRPVEVYAEFEDASGSCAEQCAQAVRLAVIYAVDRDRGMPETCSTLVNRCG